jgi:hypothetical protein
LHLHRLAVAECSGNFCRLTLQVRNAESVAVAKNLAGSSV